MIENQILQGSLRLDVNLSVTCVGMTITVKAGTFKVKGRDYPLEEQKITIGYSATPQSVQGFLTLDPDTNEAFLLVDEVPEVNGQYDHYEWSAHKLEPLHLLFIVNVPAAVTSLDMVPIKVFLRKSSTNG